MKKNITQWLNSFIHRLVKVLSSRQFFVVILILFLLQALWVALLYRHFLLFDESYHFRVTQAYAEYKSPFIFNQSEKYDEFGNLTFGSASIYHYILSLFYMIGSTLGFGETIQVTILRVLNVLMVLAGLVGFKLLFVKINIRKWVVNLSLLFFATLPLFGIVSATINYDNMVFMVVPYIFIALINALSKKHTTNYRYLSFIIFLILSIFASLVKFSVLPFAFFSVLILVIGIVKNWGVKRYFNKFISWVNDYKKIFIPLSIVAIVLFGMFFLRYGVSIIKYHTPIPSCDRVMGEDRCSRAVVASILKNLTISKNERPVNDVVQYAVDWTRLVITTKAYAVTLVDVDHHARSSPYIYRMFTLITLITVYVSFLYFWKSSSTRDKKSWLIIVIPSIGYVMTLFLFNVLNYYEYHSNINVQPRYLFMIMPVFIALSFEMIARNFSGKYIFSKFLILLVVAFCMTQGAGIVTHSLSSEPDWYRSSEPIQVIQNKTRLLLQPIVDEDF